MNQFFDLNRLRPSFEISSATARLVDLALHNGAPDQVGKGCNGVSDGLGAGVPVPVVAPRLGYADPSVAPRSMRT